MEWILPPCCHLLPSITEWLLDPAENESATLRAHALKAATFTSPKIMDQAWEKKKWEEGKKREHRIAFKCQKKRFSPTISFSHPYTTPTPPTLFSLPLQTFSYFNFKISYHFTFGAYYTSPAMGLLRLGLSFHSVSYSDVRFPSQPSNVALTWLLYYFSQSNEGRPPPEVLPFLESLHLTAISPLNHSGCLINYIWYPNNQR